MVRLTAFARSRAAALAFALTAPALAGVLPAHAATASVPPTPKPATAPTASPGSAASSAPALSATTRAERSASASARATGKAVTVDAETDTGTLVVANPNGSFTMTVDSTPVRVKQNGAWVPIDPTLALRPDGTVGAKATATGVAFSGGGTGPMAVLTQGSDTMSFGWPGRLPQPTLAGPDATYHNVLPGVDLVLTANAGGFSQLLVVHDAKAAANPKLKSLTLPIATSGVALSPSSDGGAAAVDAHGVTAFHTDTATMWDSSGVSGIAADAGGSPASAANASADAATAATTSGTAESPQSLAADKAGSSHAAHQARVAVTVGKRSETLVPDTALLTAPATHYPVYIDPAWSGNPSQLHWARISSNGWNIYDSTSTASDDHPRAGYDNWSGGGDEIARTYYSMNMGGSTGTSGIGGADVTTATLYVKNYWAAVHNSGTAVDAYWSGAPKGWNSSGLNWSNKPGWSELDSKDSYEICGSTSCTGVSPTTLSFNVLSAVKSAASAKASSLTLGLGAPSESNDLEWKQFASGGGATISVTYYRSPILTNGTGNPVTSPSTVSNGVTYVTSSSPTMKITSQDTDGEDVRNGYEIWHWSGGAATTSVATGMFSGYSVNGGSYSYTGTLADGTYAWRASSESEIGHLWSPWSKWNLFTVDTTAPTPPGVGSSQFPANIYGGAYGDSGTFTFTTNGANNVKGYLFSFDGDLGTTVYGTSGVVTWTAGTTPAHGTPYWVPANVVPNGYGSVTFAPGTVGPHHVYAKAVDSANNTSAETSYRFYAGLTTPTYAYGDKMVSGYTAADGTAVPAGTATFLNGGVLKAQANCCDIQFADPSGQGQAMLANGTSPSTVVAGDTATLSFDVPSTGYWDVGANLTEAGDYGQYRLTLDQGTSTAATLISAFDAYHWPNVTTAYRDFGTPKTAAGAPMQLKAGLHTLTVTITGKNASSGGYQAGIDVLRIAPLSATCAINDLTACLNNTAVSQPSDTAAADADGEGNSMPAPELAAAGWAATGTSLTVNGAPMTVPGYKVGAADNIVASGQLVTVPSGVANAGNAVVFLGYATNGSVHDATGVITYTGSCGGSNTQAYSIDTVPDWITGSSAARVIELAHEDKPGNTQTTDQPKLYAMSVPLACPGQAISSISLPVVSDGVTSAHNALHFLGIGIRAASFTDGSQTQNWTGTFADKQDSMAGSYAGVTFRMPVTVTYGGTSARIHLSNALGSVPVTFTDASVAVQAAGGGATAAATPTAVTFHGTSTLTIPAGGEATSDPIALALPERSTVLVSLTVNGSIANVPAHGDAQTTSYATDGDGVDHAMDVAGTAFSATLKSLPYLTGVDVTADGDTTGSLVLFGDQTVNSDTASGDGVHHVSDLIAADLAADPNGTGTVPYGILNLGQNSYTASNNLLPAATYDSAPVNAINPADRAILDRANVRTVLISSGTSDILAGASASTVQTLLTDLAQQIRSYTPDTSGNNGLITVYVATIPPSSQFTAAQETVRETVNNYILCGVSSPTAGTCSGDTGNNALGGNDDGAIDFAAAVSADGTDTGSTPASGMLFQDANGKYWPADSYYGALAQRYVTDTADSTGIVGIAPMVARTR